MARPAAGDEAKRSRLRSEGEEYNWAIDVSGCARGADVALGLLPVFTPLNIAGAALGFPD